MWLELIWLKVGKFELFGIFGAGKIFGRDSENNTGSTTGLIHNPKPQF
jgi:hypothetical protein